jgi:arylsulfatase A
MILNRIIASLILCIGVGCSTASKVPDEQVRNSPNIILIMADDLGYHDLGCYWNKNHLTPNIDNLAKNGIRFTYFHSNGAVCSPIRAALMTGRYQQRAGIEGVVTALNHRHTGLDPTEITIADFFKKQDYKTGLIGKWHLGYDTIFSPTKNGFDYFKGFVSGNIDYHSHVDQVGQYDWWLNTETIIEEGYSTDLITNSAIDFISNNKEQPFFLYIAHESPHYPYQGRNDKADRIPGNKDFHTHGSRKDKKNAYKEMIEVMDEGIGDLVEYLDKEKLLENTLLLFISDNGAAGTGSNYPLKGTKGSVWEGGHRVPAIAYWKDHINSGTSKEIVLTMDIFPTLVDLINLTYFNNFIPDGKSFLTVLNNDKIILISKTDPYFGELKIKKQ